MRHVRKLALYLVAMMALGALISGPASAKEFTANTWTQYKDCPVNNPTMQEHFASRTAVCIFGETLPGEKGGYFSLGTATVKLNKPVKIQAGVIAEENEEVEITGYKTIAPPDGKLIESSELSVVGGLKLITKEDQANAKWPQALKESFEAAIKNKETKVGVTLEVAGGNLIYETPNSLDPQNLIEETGSTFILPMKVTLSNPWLAKLGGGPCQIGNDAHPVMQHLSSAPPGWLTTEHLHFNSVFSNIEVVDSKLTDLNWPIEMSSGPSGCGGEDASYVDGALDQVLKLSEFRNGGAGTTILQGDLWDGAAEEAKKELGL